MITITLSSDHRGHAYNSTLIASVLRRTELPVHVRYWCRGFLPLSFETDRLKVEFFKADQAVTGRYPGHVNQAVFDRLRVIEETDDWDRCLILDHDMAVLCDLAPYFAEDFEGNLLMGRLFGPGNTLGLQMKQRGGLPESHAHCENHPYFFMGPMMNLKLMREERLWDTLLEAHEAIGQDEQLSLTAACGGRTKGVDKKYNLVPHWDNLEEAEKRAADAGQDHYIDHGVHWKNGVPEGVIHWTGWQKPWHKGSKVWRPDIWEGEKTSWEQLRMGLWEKPRAVDVEPENGFAVRALARRGWKVDVFGQRFNDRSNGLPKLDGRHVNNIDVKIAGADRELFQQSLDDGLEAVRFGPGSRPSEWLDGTDRLPPYLIVRGPTEVKEVRRLRALGYGSEIRYQNTDWPTGGPAPRVLRFLDDRPALAISQGEDLFLKRTGLVVEFDDAEEPVLEAAAYLETEEDSVKPWPWQISEGVVRYLHETTEAPAVILELSCGPSTVELASAFPEANIISLDHNATWVGECLGRIPASERMKIVHAPLNPILPWYDFRELDLAPMDLLLVNAPAGVQARAVRDGAVNLRRHLNPGARVILDGMQESSERDAVQRWLATGGMRIELDAGDHVVLRAEHPAPFTPAYPEGIRSLSDIAEKIYLISLPEREDRREAVRQNWAPFGLEFEVVDGIRPQQSEIRWSEMKGMEAYGKADHLRGGYVPGAVGCKRAGISSLKTFLASGAATALICQDDCLWHPDALEVTQRALLELPEDWDLVYFSASSRAKNRPYSPHLVLLGAARYCTAILWKRETAERLLPQLEACDCEWDLFMQRSHAGLNAYCVVPMPAYQAKSKSDIVGGVVQPPNH